MSVEFTEIATDRPLGSATIGPDGNLWYTSTLARDLVRARVHTGTSVADALGYYERGWSNGYIASTQHAR